MEFIRKYKGRILVTALLVALVIIVWSVYSLNNTLSTHLKVANEKIGKQTNEITTLNNTIIQKDQKIEEQANTINSLQETIDNLGKEIASLGKKISSLMAQLAEALKPKYTEPPATINQAPPANNTANGNTPKTESAPAAAKPAMVVPSGWRTYSVDGISFNYPGTWQMDDSDKAHITITSSHGVKLHYDSPKSIDKWAWSQERNTIDVTGIERLNDTGSKYPVYVVWTKDNFCLYTQFPGRIDPQPEPMTKVIFDPVIDNGVGGRANFETNYPAETSFSSEQQDDMNTIKRILESIKY